MTNLRYADDIILLVCSEIQLQELVDRLERVSRKYGLLINVEDTKVMTTGGSSCSIAINNMLVETQDDMDRQHKIVEWVVTDRTRKAEERHKWRKIVHGVANPRNEDG